jgi:hypothetical protein
MEDVGPASSARARQLTPEAWEKVTKFLTRCPFFCATLEGRLTRWVRWTWQKGRHEMDIFATNYLARMEYEERLRRAAEARRLLNTARVRKLPPLIRSLLLVFV